CAGRQCQHQHNIVEREAGRCAFSKQLHARRELSTGEDVISAVKSYFVTAVGSVEEANRSVEAIYRSGPEKRTIGGQRYDLSSRIRLSFLYHDNSGRESDYRVH